MGCCGRSKHSLSLRKPKSSGAACKRWLKLPNQLEVDELIARGDWRQRFPELREVIDWGAGPAQVVRA